MTRARREKPGPVSTPARAWTGFGPGKVILLGEHAVVYGQPAIAAPLSLGVRASAGPAASCRLLLPDSLRADHRAVLERAFEHAARACGAPAVEVRLASDLPLSVGLGSSAAVAVACARVLLGAAGRRVDARSVAAVALEMERVFHGMPSGVDHTTSAQGRLLRFVRGAAPTRGSVKRLRCPKPLPLVVVLVGERGSTRVTVAGLRERAARWRRRYQRLFVEVGQVAAEGARAIERGDLASLGDAMNVNQGLLNALGLSSPPIEERVHWLRAEGALGAKLTGAGGDGGAVLALAPEPERLVARLRKAGLTAFAETVGGREEPGR